MRDDENKTVRFTFHRIQIILRRTKIVKCRCRDCRLGERVRSANDFYHFPNSKHEVTAFRSSVCDLIYASNSCRPALFRCDCVFRWIIFGWASIATFKWIWTFWFFVDFHSEEHPTRAQIKQLSTKFRGFFGKRWLAFHFNWQICVKWKITGKISWIFFCFSMDFEMKCETIWIWWQILKIVLNRRKVLFNERTTTKMDGKTKFYSRMEFIRVSIFFFLNSKIKRE